MGKGSRLIVTADALGQDADRDAAILRARREGILTSASLMVLGPTAEEAASQSRDDPHLEVGLHAVLTGLAPALSALEIPSLVDGKGRLPSDPGVLVAAKRDEVVEELRAQHRRFRRLIGRPPTHLDVRDHAHAQRAVFEAVVTLGWEMGVPIRAVSPAMRLHLRREGLMTTDHFVDGYGGGVEALCRLLDSLDQGTTELRCRAPGPAASAGDDLSALASAEVRQRVESLGVELTGFAGL